MTYDKFTRRSRLFQWSFFTMSENNEKEVLKAYEKYLKYFFKQRYGWHQFNS